MQLPTKGVYTGDLKKLMENEIKCLFRCRKMKFMYFSTLKISHEIMKSLKYPHASQMGMKSCEKRGA